MSGARHFVRAVIVADGRSDLLDAVLDAVGRQTRRPDALHVVFPSDLPQPATPADLDGLDGLDIEWSSALGANYGATITQVLDQHPAQPEELLWLLHDDSAPLDSALVQLVATARKRSSAAVVGAAQVRWEDTSRLVGLGITTTRVGARRIDLVDEDDINQGQYDDRDDVLAVSLAGAVVRREAWEGIGGLETIYRGFGDSLHFCRRAWRAGWDVVVVPTAQVRHAQERLSGARAGGRASTYGLMRTGEWLHALAWAPWWALPVLAVWMGLSALGRAVLRLAQNESRMVGADLAVPWQVLARAPRLPGVRARIRRGSTRPRAVVRPFLIGLRGTAAYVRSAELRAYDRFAALRAPTDMVRGELAVAGARRRMALGLVTVAAIATSILLHGTWLAAIGGGRMLAGVAPGVTDVSASDLWERTRTGWDATGLGAPAIDGGFAALLLPAAALPGGTRVWVGGLLALGVALAVLGAWFAAGTATRSLWVRGLVAFGYGLWPLHLQAIADGRVGAVIAHLALPWLVLGVVRAAGWHRGEAVGDGEEFPARRLASASAAMGGAFAMVVAVVAAPVLLLPLTALLVAAGALAGTYRWRLWSIPLAALVVSGPSLVAAWRAASTGSLGEAWAILAREPAAALASEVISPAGILMGLTGTERAIAGLPVSGALSEAAVGLLIGGAALAAIIGGRAQRAVAGGFGVAAVGLVTAVAAQRAVVMPAVAPGDAAANGFSGPGASLMVLGLLAAVAASSWRLWDAGAKRRGVARTGVALAIVAAVGVLASSVVWEAWPGREERGDLHPVDARALPLVATLEQSLPTRQRVMVLSDTPGGVSYSILESDGHTTLTGTAPRRADGSPAARASVEDAAVESAATGATSVEVFTEAVATLAGAGSGAEDVLAAWGVGVVVAPPGSVIGGALSQLPGLHLIGASDYGTSYRVARPESEVAVSRAWVESGTDVVTVDATATAGGGDVDLAAAGVLIIAAPADPAWRAAADGVAMTAVDDARGRAAFAVPAGTTRVTFAYVDDDYRVWWFASLVVVVWAMVGMIPLHDRRQRVVRR